MRIFGSTIHSSVLAEAADMVRRGLKTIGKLPLVVPIAIVAFVVPLVMICVGIATGHDLSKLANSIEMLTLVGGAASALYVKSLGRSERPEEATRPGASNGPDRPGADRPDRAPKGTTPRAAAILERLDLRSASAISKTRRMLANELHPDRTGGDGDLYKEVNDGLDRYEARLKGGMPA